MLVAAIPAKTFAAYPTPGEYSIDECDQFSTYDLIRGCILNSNLTEADVSETNAELEEEQDDGGPTECLFSDETTSADSDNLNSGQNSWEFLCMTVPFFSQAIDWSNTQIAEQVGVDTTPEGSDDIDSSISQFIDLSSINTIWSSSILPIANVILALVFLVIIYGVATGGSDGRNFLSAYNIRKILPRLIIAAILINVSFYVCLIFNDLVNIIAMGISNLFQTSALLPDSTGWQLGNMMQSIGNYIMDGDILIGSDEGDPLAPLSNVVAVLYCIMCIPILLASLGLFLLLALRELILIILILASPIVFAIALLPSQNNLTSKYISVFVKLLLVYPAIVAVVMICFQVEAYTYKTFLLVGNGYSFLPIIFIAVVSLVPFITIKPLYKAYTSLFSKISGQTNDIRSRIATANRSKAADNNSSRLSNLRRRTQTAANQSNTVSRQRSIKEKLEKETLEKAQVDNKSVRTDKKLNGSTSVRDNAVNGQKATDISDVIKNKTSNITRARSERAQSSYLNNPINRTTASTNTEKTPPSLNLPNEKLERPRNDQTNPTLTLDRMKSRLKLDVDRTSDNPASIVPNNTMNNFKTASDQTLEKGRAISDVSRQRATNSDKKEPLTASLNTPKFADNAKLNKPQKDQVEANLSDKTEKILAQNQSAIADKINAAIDQPANQKDISAPPKLTTNEKSADQDATADDIETALNGDAVTDQAENNLLLKPEQPTAAKNIQKTLKDIFS
jgi:hypothetical protein